MNKYTKIFLIVIIILAVGYLLFYIIDKKAIDDTKKLSLINNSLIPGFDEAQLDETGPTRETALLSDDEVSFPVLHSNENSVLYYDRTSGNIYLMGLGKLSGNLSTVATIPPLATDLQWAPNNQGVIVTYPNHRAHYDLDDGSSNNFDSKLTNIVFTMDSDTISYVYFNNETEAGSISVADTDATNFKNILNTRSPDWDITWISNNTAALLSPRGKPYSTRTLLTLSTKDDGLTTLLEHRPELETNWAPNGERLLFSSLNPRSKEIELFHLNTSNLSVRNLHINTTASKCVWKLESLVAICAVPETPMTDSNLYELSQDNVVTIDLSSTDPIITEVATTSWDVKSPMYSSAHNKLIFVNEQDSHLYQLKLPQPQ